jgi:hypothetical protein
MALQPPQLNIWQHATARVQAAHRDAVDAMLGEPMQVESQAPTPIVAAAPLSPADSDSIGPLTQPSVANEVPQEATAPDAQSQQSESSSGDAESAQLTPLVRRKKRKAE